MAKRRKTSGVFLSPQERSAYAKSNAQVNGFLYGAGSVLVVYFAVSFVVDWNRKRRVVEALTKAGVDPVIVEDML